MKRSMVVCKYIVFMYEVESAVIIRMRGNVYTGTCLCEYKGVIRYESKMMGGEIPFSL